MTNNTPKRKHKGRTPAPKGRLSRKTKEAIELIATCGKTQRDAAKAVGMNESALSRALSRDIAKQALIEAKSNYLDEVDKLHAFYKRRAIMVAGELMEDAKSESVRMRAVEFFAGESKSAGPSASLNVTVNSGGYGYVRPDQQIVDITPGETESSD